MSTVLESKLFCNRDIADALESCLNEGYHPLSMPKLADARIEAPNDHEVWRNWLAALSIRATGRNGKGEPVVVYSHDSALINPCNLRIRQRIKGAMVLEQQEFYNLEATAQPGYVVEHEKLKQSTSGVIPLSKALMHPQTIPFLGGKDRAERYLERHQEVFGNLIGVWHCDDLGEVPVARLLFLGYNGISGLDGGSYFPYGLLDRYGRFIGVRRRRASAASKSGAAAQKISTPTLEETLLTLAKEFVHPRQMPEYESLLRERLGQPSQK